MILKEISPSLETSLNNPWEMNLIVYQCSTVQLLIKTVSAGNIIHVREWATVQEWNYTGLSSIQLFYKRHWRGKTKLFLFRICKACLELQSFTAGKRARHVVDKKGKTRTSYRSNLSMRAEWRECMSTSYQLITCWYLHVSISLLHLCI